MQIEELKAALSNKEYQIITECALSNISETPRIVPPLSSDIQTSSEDVASQVNVSFGSEIPHGDVWVAIKVSVVIHLIELCLHAGVSRDTSLATVQV